LKKIKQFSEPSYPRDPFHAYGDQIPYPRSNPRSNPSTNGIESLKPCNTREREERVKLSCSS